MNATRPGADEHKNIASRNSGSVLKRVIDLGAIGGTGPDFVRTHARSDDPETSKDAALKAAKFSATHQGKILQSLHEKGPQTAKEIAVNIGFTSVQVSRRMGDMERAKIIESTGQVREGCREFIANS